MENILINFRGSTNLKEALRIVAFKQGHSNISKTLVTVLENDPEIKKELAKLNGSSKKKVA